MPQLDLTTYFSQFFWLCVFFFAFYLCCVKYFLPALSRLTKFRANQQNQTELEEMPSYDDLSFESLKACRQSLVNLDEKMNEWVGLTQNQLNQTKFGTLNQKYLESIASQSFENQMVLAQMGLVFPPSSSPLKGVQQDYYALRLARKFITGKKKKLKKRKNKK